MVKAQARDMLGIQLTDHDVANIPLVKVDLYGNFIPDPATGFAQIIVDLGPDGMAQTDDDVVLVANPNDEGGQGTLVPVTAPRTGHSFLLDIAHSANPFSSQDGHFLAPDADGDIGDDGNPETYDDELLDQHFMAGDGRVNENIAPDRRPPCLPLRAQPPGRAHQAGGAGHGRRGVPEPVASWYASHRHSRPTADRALVWNGERLFQAAKFGTEMQYQHLVFEEFARKVQVNVDAFLAPGGLRDPARPGDPRRVRARGLSLRPLHAARRGRPASIRPSSRTRPSA